MTGPSFEEETVRACWGQQPARRNSDTEAIRSSDTRSGRRSREQDRDQVTQRGVHDRQQDGRSVLLISLAWPPAFAGAWPRRARGRCAGVKRGETWRLESTKATKHRWRGGRSG